MKILCEKHTIREVKNRLIQIRAILFIDPFIQNDIPADKRICSAPTCKIMAKFIIRHHSDDQKEVKDGIN